MKILLIEDDVMIAEGIVRKVRQSAMEIEHLTLLSEARKAIKDENIGLLILDLGLPDGNGLVFLGELRKKRSDLPVLLLTARDEPRAIVLGLDSGADDYMVKPFDMSELIARVRALLRRRMGRTAPAIEYEKLVLDPNQMQVYLNKEPVSILLSHFRLLQFLLESQGKVKTKQQIIDSLYRWDKEIEENTIEVYVSQLRKKLWPELIKTIRGVGYIVPKCDSHH
ncbi:MAG: response regulator transcription factor [Cellvibrionaceae bacterium]